MNQIFSATWIKARRSNKLCATDFHRAFSLHADIVKAELSLTAHGTFVANLNGVRVGKDILAPGWTAYHKRQQYLTYDVTDLLQSGENELTVGVGRGWFFHTSKKLAFKNLKYDEAALLCALTVQYADGTEDLILSDKQWQTARSNIVFNDIYDGETLDLSARKGARSDALEIVYPKNILIPAEGEPIREQERIPGQKLIVTPKGELVVDFGQEVTGYVEFSAKLPRGAEVCLQHFEMLDRDGNVYTENLRSAKEQFRVISGGRAFKVKPQYTFYGFRFIQVTGLETVVPEDFTAIVVHSDMTRTGRFSCANELLNRFASNVLWGQKGNFLDIPTDCPQRDERLGWTGDCEMFCRTAAINYDVRRFYEKWYNDVAAEQHEDGMIPHLSLIHI